MAIHRDLPTSELHEPKGADGAANRDVYVANGSGSGVFKQPVRFGIYDYNDTATTASPIVLSTAGTFFKLTNNGLGGFTNKTYALDDVPDIWNTTTNQFDFTGLNLGDRVDFRIDFDATTTGTNHEIVIDIQLGIGGSPYNLILHRENLKAAATYKFTKWFSVYMGDNNTLNNPAEIRAKSDTGTTDSITVNGWYISPMVQGEI